jgi:hypothetical protein
MPHPDTIRLICTIIAGCLFVGVLIRPVFGVTAYMIVMVARPGLFYPALGRVELLVGVAMLGFMVLTGRFRRLTPADPINRNMFLLFGVMLVSMLQAIDFAYSWEWMFEFSKVLAFYMMTVTMLDSEEDVSLFLWAFGMLMALLAYTAVYNYHAGIIVESQGGGRIDYATAEQGMGSGHVALANLSLQGMPVILFLSLASKNSALKAAGIALVLMCGYAVVISGSRGGFVGLVAFYLCLLYLSKNRQPLIVAGVVGFLLFPLVAPGGYLGYVESILGLFTGDAGLSGNSRILGLRHGIEMMINRPILGVGPGCYPIARRMWFGWGLWAHNLYGELMGDLGIIGTVVWFKFLVGYLRDVNTLRVSDALQERTKLISTGILVATAVRLVVGMASHSVYIFFWYMLAAVVVVMKRLEEKNEEYIEV